MTLPASQLQGDDSLSALIDGELDEDTAQRLLRRLSTDAHERDRFAQYCAIGDALRGLPDGDPGFTARVMAALEREPTVLAPLRRQRDRRPALWLAAATVAAISWGLWHSDPRQPLPSPPLASAPMLVPAVDATAYLAAHQDFAQAVMAMPEMQFTRVSLSGDGR